MPTTAGYRIVKLRGGTNSVHSLAAGETFHPGIGPEAEAEALYVRQLQLPVLAAESSGEFVIWDVGLGAAANAVTAIRRIDEHLSSSKTESGPVAPPPKRLRILSFDRNSDALRFALEHAEELGYLAGFETHLQSLTATRSVEFNTRALKIRWELVTGDFPSLVDSPEAAAWPKPDAISFDPHSPKSNPEMWTISLFACLFELLEGQRPCRLATFSRSTLVRVGMLLGGFFVGAGHPTGFKEETTIAANRLEFISDPLDQRWLERARRSDSAEPLWKPSYRQAPLTPETFEKLARHRQFQS